ncbi:MAG TPA: SMP-30/gluconolactonase/LRE family protein [Candidatus Binataceae bacterium]|jgi:sugar lactone lactonase YvrE|nr:SMP-30/gluconolactonase/LRE family protein [Candidatus Binataceae bacterium]
MLAFETIVSGNYELLEAPRIDEQGRLYFSEIGHFIDPNRGTLFCRTLEGEIKPLLQRRQIGGMALVEGGGAVLSGADLVFWNEATSEVRKLLSSYEGKPIRRFNDLTTDSRGSIFVGSVNPAPADGSKRPPGELYRLDPGGRVTKLWDGIEFSNGLGFSPDEKLLYHADTFTNAVWAYDVKQDRTLTDRRIFGKLPDAPPDGLAVDAEGGVWVAATSSGELLRFKSDGTLGTRVKVWDGMVMSVGFGGADLQDFYVTTGINTNVKALTGSIRRARIDIPGAPVAKARI